MAQDKSNTRASTTARGLWPLAVFLVFFVALFSFEFVQHSAVASQLAKEKGAEAKSSDSATEKPHAALDEAINKKVNVELKSGREFLQAVLKNVSRDKSGKITIIHIQEKRRNRTLPIRIRSVWQVTHEAKPVYTAPTSSGKKSSKTGVHSSSMAEKRSKQEEAERKKWLARLAARGVKAWPELSAEEHQKVVEEHKEFANSARRVFPGLQLYETDRFLFYSNFPPQQARPYAVKLDAMYDMMCDMYGIKRGTPVFRGKALVFAFLEQNQFLAFEQQFMKSQPKPSIYGLCHSRGNGNVIIACYRGDRRADFAQMLVHETSHGFIFRYKTRVRLPSWVNEGMAEWIGRSLVPESKSVARKERASFEHMRQTHSVGADFLKTEGNIEGLQYGIASNMTTFLIKSDPKKYATFIEQMKEGVPCEESLQNVYGATYDQLILSYGRAIGIPDLHR